DDVDAPHNATITSSARSLDELVAQLLEEYPLPMIYGGDATWVLSSSTPLAVAAQQWDKARVFAWPPEPLEEWGLLDGQLHLHWTYYALVDAIVVPEILHRLSLAPPAKPSAGPRPS